MAVAKPGTLTFNRIEARLAVIKATTKVAS